MTITSAAKAELAGVKLDRKLLQSAELAAVIRFAGTTEHIQGTPVLTIELDHPDVAERVAQTLKDVFRIDNVLVTPPVAQRKASRYLLRVDDCVDELLRKLGLITRNGYTVVGLPPHLVNGGVLEAEAVWRGALMARGALSEPGRSTALEVACPCTEVAIALCGFARRLGLHARSKETRGQERVIVKEQDAVAALLSRLGAHTSRMEWDEKIEQRAQRSGSHRLANFDDANLRRSARAAMAAAARVERALEILADDVPEHLAEAGALRVAHRQASLEELGRLSDPPMTKDAIAGRIRRLLSMADKRAEELGIPNTAATAEEKE